MRRTPLKSSTSMNIVPSGTPTSLQLPAKLSFAPVGTPASVGKENAAPPPAPPSSPQQATPRTVQRQATLRELDQLKHPMELLGRRPTATREASPPQQARRRPRSLTEMEPGVPTRAISMCGTEGWLDVLAERDGATDRWRRRYVRVQADRLICHVGGAGLGGDAHSTPSKEAEAVVVPLGSATCVTEGLLLTVRCAATNTVYRLRASSLAEAKFWSLDLEAACAGVEPDPVDAAAASSSLDSSPDVPTPTRISRRRAFLALEERSLPSADRAPGTVMKADLPAPPSSPASLLGSEDAQSPRCLDVELSPSWTDQAHAISANGSFAIENPCASPSLEASGKTTVADDSAPQAVAQAQQRFGRLRQALRGNTKTAREEDGLVVWSASPPASLE